MMKISFPLILLAFGMTAHAQTELHSVYTSVDSKDCVIYASSELETDPPIDHLHQECPGFGGYQVMITGGDLRYPLQLKYGNQDIFVTQFYFFHEIGSESIEWLYTRSTEGQVTYKALIHRITYDGKDDAYATTLVVTKLAQEKTCAVALVPASDKMNQEARDIAAKADTMPCVNFESLDL